MRRAAGILVAALLLVAGRGSAQTTIGEFRLAAVAGAALAATGAHASPEFPPPGGRALGGVSGGLSFVHGNLSVGPEGMLLRGSDRRMYQLGGVARLGLAKGIVRPFVVVGGGVSGWDRKMVLPFDPAAGARWIGDLTTFSGSAGGGVVLGARRLALVVEARGHKSLGKKYDQGSRDLLSFSIGGRLSW